LVRNGETKWLLRQVLDRYVPRHLVERPKMGFSVPIGEWLRVPLRDWAEDLLAPSRYGGGILDVKPAQEIWRKHIWGRRTMGRSYGPFFPSRRGEDIGASKCPGGRRRPVMRWQFLPGAEGTQVRILCVTNMYPSPQRPGYGAFVWQQVEQLRRFGHTVEASYSWIQSKMNYLRCTLDVMRMTSALAYDIVHVHYGYSAYPAVFRLHLTKHR
jgi:hypothetical protein